MASKTPKSEATQERIFAAALGLFRARGFGQTSMRDIARASGLSLGAAYHHFASKDDLVRAYSEWMQSEHERRLAALPEPPPSAVAARLGRLLETKLELLADDRRLLTALFQSLADPSSPLSVFSPATRALRERSLAQFVAAFAESGLAPEAQALLGRAAWLGHLALFLYFIHDDSPGQRRTWRLASELASAAGALTPWLALPLAAPFVARAWELARELGLVEERAGASGGDA